MGERAASAGKDDRTLCEAGGSDRTREARCRDGAGEAAVTRHAKAIAQRRHADDGKIAPYPGVIGNQERVEGSGTAGRERGQGSIAGNVHSISKGNRRVKGASGIDNQRIGASRPQYGIVDDRQITHRG